MGVINTGLTEAGIRSEFFHELEGTKTYYQDLATRIPSTTRKENHRWLGTVPQLREWVPGSGRLVKGLRSESYIVENEKYEATIEVDRDEYADDQTGQLPIRIAELAKRAATHKDFLIAQCLADGGSAGSLSYDAVPFFSTLHESGDSGQQSNDVTLGVVYPEVPSLSEFIASFNQATAQMGTYKDDQGEPIPFARTGLVCVVPVTMLFIAREAVGATFIEGTSNIRKSAARVIALPWLTDEDRWYLLETGRAMRPFIFQDREPIEFTALTEPDSATVFKREKYLFGVRARYAIAYGNWMNAVRTVFV